MPALGHVPSDHRSRFSEQPSSPVPGSETPSLPESGASYSHEAPGARGVGTGAALAHSPPQNSTVTPAEDWLTDLIGVRAAAQSSDIVFSDRWLGDEGLSVDDIETRDKGEGAEGGGESMKESYVPFHGSGEGA